MRVLFLVRRVGPYHDARFEAAGRALELTVVETRPDSQEYPWTTAAAARSYRLEPLGRSGDPEIGLRGPELSAALERRFKSARPEAVACTGWADPEYHEALRLCHARRIPAIVMSDSTYDDERRRWWKERMKGPLILVYWGAIVAGSRSRDYLRRFGFPADAIFEPWDVVDNDYFAPTRGLRGGAAVSPSWRPYFLCISRYLPKKNLVGLIEGFAAYRRRQGAGAWDLVILGSGELEQAVDHAAAKAGVAAQVHRPGFVQYDRLPSFYAGAGACILPSLSDQWGLAVNEAMASGVPVLVSTGCGCAPDLVAAGENGFTFDPRDPAALAGLLRRITALPEAERRRMGGAGRAKIAHYSPGRFAEALVAAANHVGKNRKSAGLAGRLMLGALTRRP